MCYFLISRKRLLILEIPFENGIYTQRVGCQLRIVLNYTASEFARKIFRATVVNIVKSWRKDHPKKKWGLVVEVGKRKKIFSNSNFRFKTNTNSRNKKEVLIGLYFWF